VSASTVHEPGCVTARRAVSERAEAGGALSGNSSAPEGTVTFPNMREGASELCFSALSALIPRHRWVAVMALARDRTPYPPN
jgi:hypothetical protein